MTKRFVPAVLVLVAVAIIGWLLAGAVATGDQLAIRFLAAIIVAGAGLYVISDLRMRSTDEPERSPDTRRPASSADNSPPANSTAAFMATVTGKRTTAAPAGEPKPVSVFDLPVGGVDTVEAERPPADAPAADGEDPVPSDPHPTHTGSGGTALNGTALNGTAPNATALNGTAPNGTDPNGTAGGGPSGDDAEDAPAYQADDDELAAWPARPTGADRGRVPPTHRTSLFSEPDRSEADDQDEFWSDRSTRAVAHRSNPAPLFGSGALQGVDRDETSVEPNPTALFPAVEVELDPKTVVLRSRTVEPSAPVTTSGDPSTPDHRRAADPAGPTGADRPAARPAPLRADQRSDQTATPTPPAIKVVDMTTWPPPTSAAASSATTDPGRHADATEPRVESGAAAEPAAPADAVIEDGDRTGTDPVKPGPTSDSGSTDRPTALPATFGSTSPSDEPRDQVAAASYAGPMAPIYDLPIVRAAVGADDIETAITAGELEVISSLIRQGRLSTSGPISDRDVRTMVYVAFTSSELRKILTAGGVIDGDNSNLDLGPVELFQGPEQPCPLARLEAAPAKRLPDGVDIDLDAIDLDAVEPRSFPAAKSRAL
ncbi:MAG: hypothetical protein ACK5PP_12465 [Acidimicrobiales bacterium]